MGTNSLLNVFLTFKLISTVKIHVAARDNHGRSVSISFNIRGVHITLSSV